MAARTVGRTRPANLCSPNTKRLGGNSFTHARTSEPQSSTFLHPELLDSPWEGQRKAFQIIALVDELLTLLEPANELVIVLLLVVAPLDWMVPEILANPSRHRLVQGQVGDVWRLPTCVGSGKSAEAMLLQSLVVRVHDGTMTALIETRTTIINPNVTRKLFLSNDSTSNRFDIASSSSYSNHSVK